MRLLNKLISTFLLLGNFPYASGTIASIVTVIIWGFFIKSELDTYFIFFFIFTFVFGLASVHFYLLETNDDDPSEVVIDEVAGQSIPLIYISSLENLDLIIISFIAFRFFDILKIYPINRIEKLKGTLGVMLDDIFAGVYALLCVIIYSLFI
tara:strand:- start:369 stop:824 length:456 start_codon:yes stop_codon:yes gene_type:complete